MFLLIFLSSFVITATSWPVTINNTVAPKKVSGRPLSHTGSDSMTRKTGMSRKTDMARSSKRSRLAASITCYDQAGFQGDRLVADEYLSSLGAMDNRIGSCCFTGIWILYAEQVYNTFNPGSANWFGYGNNACFDAGAFNNQASSLRYTGAPDDMFHDTVNMYFNEYFNGEEEYSYVDKPQLNYDNRALSLIVTGCSFWTLYQDRYYQGSAVCVAPSNQASCEPGFYSTRSSLSGIAGDISSLRRGCYSKRWLLPDNYNHNGRNNNKNNIESRSWSRNENKNHISNKRNNNFETKKMESTTGDSWVGWGNVNNTVANSKVAFV